MRDNWSQAVADCLLSGCWAVQAASAAHTHASTPGSSKAIERGTRTSCVVRLEKLRLKIAEESEFCRTRSRLRHLEPIPFFTAIITPPSPWCASSYSSSAGDKSNSDVNDERRRHELLGGSLVDQLVLRPPRQRIFLRSRRGLHPGQIQPHRT